MGHCAIAPALSPPASRCPTALWLPRAISSLCYATLCPRKLLKTWGKQNISSHGAVPPERNTTTATKTAATTPRRRPTPARARTPPSFSSLCSLHTNPPTDNTQNTYDEKFAHFSQILEGGMASCYYYYGLIQDN